MKHFPEPLLKLIAFFKRLPGVGTKGAERFAFDLLRWTPAQLAELGKRIAEVRKDISTCSTCHSLMDGTACPFCTSKTRDQESLCITASAREVFAVEATGAFRGLYHVLGGLLSPLDGHYPDRLDLERLQKRLTSLGVKEVILAFDPSLEGDATALYLKERLQPLGIKLQRLALGLPMGTSLEYVDSGTLKLALQGRQLL